MIKKTFKTIFKNPKLIIFFVVLFALSILTKTLYSFMQELMFNSSSFAMGTLLYMQITQLYGFFDSVLQGIFIWAPIMYCVLLIDRDNLIKGWYKRGLKRNWWRYIVIWGAVYLVQWVTNNIISRVTLYSMMDTKQMIDWIKYSYFAISLIFGFITYFVLAPAIAEDKFADGLRNMLIIGRRYFIRLLGVYVLCMLPLYIVSLTPDIFIKIPVLTSAFSLAMTIFSMFIYVYSMNLYLSEKEKLEPTAKQMLGNEE